MRTEKTFFNKNNFLNIGAAITIQADLANDKKCTTASSQFLNTSFNEHENIFNFHLHSDQPFDYRTFLKTTIPCDKQWATVSEYVQRKDISILVINGALVKPVTKMEIIADKLPETFLGKLLALLWDKYISFNGSIDSGMTILSTGDLEGFADRLEAYVLEIAHFNKMNPEFLDWVEDSNLFCSTYTGDLFDFLSPANKHLSVLLPGRMSNAN
jgi:mannitol-1-phosphate/altronate dehydrogenase